MGIGFDVGISGRAGYIPDHIRPENFLSGTGVSESIQVGPISGSMTSPFPTNGEIGLEIGTGGKFPLGGSMTYGRTTEILDIKRDIVKPVKETIEGTIEDIKDIFREKNSREREDRDRKEKNVFEKVIRSIFG